MIDVVRFSEEMWALIHAEKWTEAEQLLLGEYGHAKSSLDTDDVDFLLGALAQFYALREQNGVAEGYFLERERASARTRASVETTYAKYQTAMFYLYNLRNFEKTITKVNELPAVDKLRDDEYEPYYSALTLKGIALVELDAVSDAERVLDELIELARQHRRLPFGDEMNFIESLASRSTSQAKCKVLLNLIVSRIRDPENNVRARRLLSSLGEQPTN